MPVETIAFFIGWLGLALAGGFLLFYGWNSAHEYVEGRADPKHSVVSVTLKEAKKTLIRRIKLPKLSRQRLPLHRLRHAIELIQADLEVILAQDRGKRLHLSALGA